MKRSARIAAYIGTGIAVGLLLAVILIFSVTRSRWGMDVVRDTALGWLTDRVQGEVRIGRISGGGLLAGARLHDISIIDEKNRPFLSVDSADVNYDWRTLLGGSVVLTHVTLYEPRVHLEKLPGDTAWNYQYVFEDTTGGPRDGQRQLIMFDDARIVNGFATVLLPVETPIQPRDTARIITEMVPGGLGRIMHFDSLNGQLSRVIWETPLEPGRIFDVRSLSGLAYVWREPMRITAARGTLTMRDTVVSLDFPVVRLPSTRGAVLGRVLIQEDRNFFDLQFDLDEFAFRDMQWLYDMLPERGGGSGRLRMQTQPVGTLYHAENARIQTPGTNLAGDFGVVVGDTLYFTKVDLRASPLDVSVIERMLPNGLPVDGLLMGTVEITGPLSALETSGDMRFTSGGSTSAMTWSGVVDVPNRSAGVRGVRAQVRDFDLAIVHALQPGMTLIGHVTGSVTASRANAGRMRIDAELEHRGLADESSTFAGGGFYLGPRGARSLDMDWTAGTVSLAELGRQYPALSGMTGAVSGPVRISGPIDDITYNAELTTAAGPLLVDGWLRGAGAQPRYGGRGLLKSFALDELDARLPTATVSGRFAFDVAGNDLGSAAGTVRLELDSAQLHGVPIQHTLVAAHLADGLLHVDTLSATTLAGAVTGRGSLGLTDRTNGRIALTILSESLTGLEANLFGAAAAGAAESPKLAGSVYGTASIDGSIHDATFSGAASLADVVVGPLRTAGARVEVNGRMFGDRGTHLTATAHGDTVRGYGHRFDVADVSIEATPDSTTLVASGSSSGIQRLLARGSLSSPAGEPGVRTFHLAELSLGGTNAWSLAAPASFTLAGTSLTLGPLTLHNGRGGSATLADGSLGWGDASPLDFLFTLRGLPVADFLRLAHSEEAGGGTIDGEVRITGTAASPVITATTDATDLRYGDLRLESTSAELAYSDLNLTTSFEARRGARRVLAGGGRAPFDMRFATVAERRLDRPLTMAFTADSLPLVLPLGALRGFRNVSGRLDGTISATGTTLDPALGGSLSVRDGGATWDATGVHYSAVTGGMELVSDRVFDVLASGRADGTMSVSGRLDFTDLTDPTFDMLLAADRLLAVKRREAVLTMTGDIQLGGRYSRPEVGGAVTIDEGSLFLDEIYRRYLVVELDPLLLFNVVDTSLVAVRRVLPVSDNPFLRNLRINDARVRVGPDSWLRSRELDVAVTGDLTVAFDRRDADLRMTGTLAVLRGTYQLEYPPLQARRFQVREGTIEFPGTPGIDPNLGITAVYRAPTKSDPLDILAHVSGSLQTPRVRLSSAAEPPISESDLASYLFFGAPSWEVASFRDGTTGLNTDFGLRTIAPSVLGYAASGLQTLGQRFGLLDYVGITAADGAERVPFDNAFANFFASTQLDLGVYVSPEVYLAYTQRFSSTSPGVRLEWRFSPTYTAQMFVEDRFANTPSFGLQRDAGLRRVAGFFLFREWGY